MNNKPETLAAKERYAHLLHELTELDAEINVGGETPQQIMAARMRLHEDLHTIRRRKAREKAKAVQPIHDTRMYEGETAKLIRFLRQPLTADERVPSGLDLLARNVKEAEDAGDFWDLVYDLARFYRKAWGENLPWGDITAEVKSNGR